jgi:hypothetical protein
MMSPLRHPSKVTRFYFQQIFGIMSQWEKEKAVLYTVEVLPPYQTAFMLPQLQGNIAS